MNVLIITMSKVNSAITKEAFRERLFHAPNGKQYSGKQTNEVPMKYFFYDLAQKKQRLFDRIICLVTKECLETKIEAIDHQTTFDYFQHSMENAVRDLSEQNPDIQRILAEEYGSDISKYIKQATYQINIEGGDKKYINDKIMEAIDSGEKRDQYSLYIDYTGGSRMTTLVAIWLARIYESAIHAKIVQIVYADIMKEKAELIDCTDYYNMLGEIEGIGSKTHKEIQEKLQRVGLLNASEKIDTQELDDIKKDEANRLTGFDQSKQKKTEERVMSIQKKKSGNKLYDKYVDTDCEKLQKDIKENKPFTKLKENNDQALLHGFMEKVIDILIDKKVIISNKEQNINQPNDQKEKIMKAAFVANKDYYDTDNNKKNIFRSTGVVRKTREYIDYLRENVHISPVNFFENQKRTDFKRYQRLANNWYVNGCDQRKATFFLEYCKDKNISITGTSREEEFLEFNRMMTLYFTYGFPFACLDKTGQHHPEISNYYLNVVTELMEELEQIKKRDIREYQEKLACYADEKNGELEKRIPILVHMECWKVNTLLYPHIHEEQFVKELGERVNRVRPYRNAIAHKLTNEFSTADVQRKMAEEVRAWIDEYAQIVGEV